MGHTPPGPDPGDDGQQDFTSTGACEPPCAETEPSPHPKFRKHVLVTLQVRDTGGLTVRSKATAPVGLGPSQGEGRSAPADSESSPTIRPQRRG